MARINKGIEETILDAIEFYKHKHSPSDVLLILYVEAPFRTTMYIDKAIHTMQLYNVDVVDGVRLDDSLFYMHNGKGLKPWEPGRGLRLERDDIYRRGGGLHLIKREFFEAEKRMLGGRIGHIEMDEKAAFLIKSEFDWQIARFLAEKRK